MSSLEDKIQRVGEEIIRVGTQPHSDTDKKFHFEFYLNDTFGSVDTRLLEEDFTDAEAAKVEEALNTILRGKGSRGYYVTAERWR